MTEDKPTHAHPGFVRAAAILGFLAVALGAFGAHALEEFLQETGRLETWNTAVLYHLTHSIALAWCASVRGRDRGPDWAFLVGILIFGGSLYALCLTQISVFGAITPIGGLSLLIGWAWLIVKP